jgi:hypothetical protein
VSSNECSETTKLGRHLCRAAVVLDLHSHSSIGEAEAAAHRSRALVEVVAPNTTEPLTVRLDDAIGGCDVSVIPIQPGATYGHPA